MIIFELTGKRKLIIIVILIYYYFTLGSRIFRGIEVNLRKCSI